MPVRSKIQDGKFHAAAGLLAESQSACGLLFEFAIDIPERLCLVDFVFIVGSGEVFLGVGIVVFASVACVCVELEAVDWSDQVCGDACAAVELLCIAGLPRDVKRKLPVPLA